MSFSNGGKDPKDAEDEEGPIFKQLLYNLSREHDSALFSIEERYFGWNEIFSHNNAGGLQWLTVE